MATMPKEIKLKIIGIGNNRFGLRVLSFVAKLFDIDLRVKAQDFKVKGKSNDRKHLSVL